MASNRKPQNVGGEGYRWGRDSSSVEVARNDNGKIHLQFGEHLEEEDLWVINMSDSVDMKVKHRDVKILGLKLKLSRSSL